MLKKMVEKMVEKTTRSIYGIRHQDYFRAAEEGDLATVIAYLHKKGDRSEKLNAIDKEGNTALIMAAFNNRVDVVNHLLSKNANHTHKNNSGQTAEDVARAQGYTGLANYLHSICDISPRQFVKAAEEGNISTVQTYTEAKKYDVQAMSVTGEYGNTPLILAVANGQTYAALVMLEKIYDLAIINAGNQNGMTALHWAAFHGDIPCLRALIHKGANIAQMNRDGKTAEDEALSRGFTDVAAILANERHVLERQREITEEEFLKAAEKGDLETVKSYLNTRRTNPHAIGIAGLYGNTALHLAALNGQTATLKLLLEALDAFDPIIVQSIINKTNQEGSTALINAAYNVDMPSCIALLQRGADVSHVNKQGINAETAVYCVEAEDNFSENFELASILSVKGIVNQEAFLKAAEDGQLEVIKLYLAINYDNMSAINASNALGDTALISAIRNQHFEVADALLKIPGIAINSVNQLGNSALSWAAYLGNKKLVAQLVHMGANTVITNVSGGTLIDEVLAKGLIEIANLLAVTQPLLEEKSNSVVVPSTISFAQRLKAIGFAYHKIPEDFLDDITQTIIEDPVQLSSGAIFDRDTIKQYLNFHHNPAFIPCPKIPGKVIGITELSKPTHMPLKNRIEAFVTNKEVEFAKLQSEKLSFTPVVMHVQPAKPSMSYSQLLYALKKTEIPTITTYSQVNQPEEKQEYIAPPATPNQKFVPDQRFLAESFAEYAKKQNSESVSVRAGEQEVTASEVIIAPETSLVATQEHPKPILSSESGQRLFDHKPVEVERDEEAPKPKRKVVNEKRAVVCL